MLGKGSVFLRLHPFEAPITQTPPKINYSKGKWCS